MPGSAIRAISMFSNKARHEQLANKTNMEQFSVCTRCYEHIHRCIAGYFAGRARIEEICRFQADFVEFYKDSIVTRAMEMESSLMHKEINSKIVAHICVHEGSAYEYINDACKIRTSKEATIDPSITCDYPESINEFILEQTMNESAKKDRCAKHILYTMMQVKETAELQPERFMMDLTKARHSMHTIERGYELTISQATILFVHGLNKELRKEMRRLLIIPGNKIKHWTVIPADEAPEVSTVRLREYGELAQHLYTKMATEGGGTASLVISLFAVRDTGGSDQANPIYEESEEEVELLGPPPLPSDMDSLSIIRDRRRAGDSPYRPAAKPFQHTPMIDSLGLRKKYPPRPGSLNPGQN